MKRLLSTFTAMIFALALSAQTGIIPKPQKEIIREGYFRLDKSCVIYSNEKGSFNTQYIQEKLIKATGFAFSRIKKQTADNFIKLEVNPSLNIPEEGYLLNVDEKGITIDAKNSSGIFYGIQSLLQLLPPTVYSGRVTGREDWKVPFVNIEDYPRFSYRGMMLDVSRTFFDYDVIIKYIDWLSYHKINKFHWHLADDNGWRIEIKKYPELTSKGAWRGPGEVLYPSFGSGNKRYGGFYTQDQIKKIVAYAAERNIEIIPEIDLPGHSRAVTATYPDILCRRTDESLSVQGEGKNVWCVSKEPNYEMLENIIKELVRLFPSKYIHIGGDEVNYSAWKNCPDCQVLMQEKGMKEPVELLNYFVRRMEKIVEKNDRHMAGWEEIIEGGDLKPETRVYAWRGVDKGIAAVSKGQPTIMQPGSFCYLDMKQSEVERGHNWAGIVTLEKTYSLDPTGDKNLPDSLSSLILGVQGGLWTELLNKPVRFIEYQTFPRLAAIAEIGWTNQDLRNWDDFKTRLERKHYSRMYNMGISFRLPPPSITYNDGALRSELPYPWAVVRYTSDETTPDEFSPVFRGEIYTDNPFKYRFATFYKDEIISQAVMVNNVSYDYQKPSVKIESSLTFQTKFPSDNLLDFNFSTYARTTERLKKGDYLTYIFEKPVFTKRISVSTGIPNIDFYGITEGYVEYSYDGKLFIKGNEFTDGISVIFPKEPVSAVRVVVTGESDGFTAVFTDLKID